VVATPKRNWVETQKLATVNAYSYLEKQLVIDQELLLSNDVCCTDGGRNVNKITPSTESTNRYEKHKSDVIYL